MLDCRDRGVRQGWFSFQDFLDFNDAVLVQHDLKTNQPLNARAARDFRITRARRVGDAIQEFVRILANPAEELKLQNVEPASRPVRGRLGGP